MSQMTAVRLHAAGDLRVEMIDRPGDPGPGQVRIAVRAAGICGSDLHNYRTGQWISRSPSVAGHEFAGEVIAVGAGVTHLRKGDRVVADSRFFCGDCINCRSGLSQVCRHLEFVGEVCDGGFAEETELPARLVIAHDPAIDPAIAAMAEPLAVALHAVRRLGLKAGDSVLVAGCGPIGGLAALLLSRLHDGPILVSDRNAARAELVAGLVGGTIVGLERGGIDKALPRPVLRHAIDATGSVAVLESLVDLLDPAGGIAIVGISHGKIALDPNLLVEKEMALLGCHAFGDELAEAVALLGPLSAKLARIIDRQITLEAVPEAYRQLLAGQVTGLKTIIRMDGAAT